MYQTHLQQIRKLIPLAKEKLAALRDAHQALVKQSEEVAINNENVKKKIKVRGRELIAEYTTATWESVQHLTEELEVAVKEKLGFLSTQEEEVEVATTLLESCLDYVEEVRISLKQHILSS